jgi:putative transposase
MLTAMNIRLQLSELDAGTLEMMQARCRGHYNWWVMKLRAGERWNWKNEKRDVGRKPDVRAIH